LAARFDIRLQSQCRNRLTARVSFDFQSAYDELNPADDDYRFYAALAASVGVSRAVDLGCGTGTLARMIASDTTSVVGVDPDPEMLRVARSKDPEGRVDWRLGYSDILEPESAELTVMSGHVAQVFSEDDAWRNALQDLHRALAPGGLLAFESRNPSARRWEAWTRELTLRTVETPEGAVEFWHESAEVDLPRVSYDTLTRNLRTGEAATTRDVLAFRDEQTLRASLEHAGFDVDYVYGDWDRTPPATASPELIVIARKPSLRTSHQGPITSAGWIEHVTGQTPGRHPDGAGYRAPGSRGNGGRHAGSGRRRG
jgi:SAM-dependent methyltransferase